MARGSFTGEYVKEGVRGGETSSSSAFFAAASSSSAFLFSAPSSSAFFLAASSSSSAFFCASGRLPITTGNGQWREVGGERGGEEGRVYCFCGRRGERRVDVAGGGGVAEQQHQLHRLVKCQRAVLRQPNPGDHKVRD